MRKRFLPLFFVGLAAFAVVTAFLIVERNGNAPNSSEPAIGPDSTVDFAAIEPRIRRFCGDCHAFPMPDTFPKRAWHDEVKQGYGFYRESLRTDLDVPPMRDVVAWYRKNAPEELTVLTGRESTKIHDSFRVQTINPPDGIEFASISSLKWAPHPDGMNQLFCSDMKNGSIHSIRWNQNSLQPVPMSTLDNPAHVESCDLDSDGHVDFVIADLGSFLPEDHEQGKVVWLAPDGEDSHVRSHVLMDGLGRVADVQPADFDSDGDVDLVVAEFGWRRTGRILLLEQQGSTEGIPSFQLTVVDQRHGTIHVPVADLNGDGHPDFVALVSQEYEIIEAFINDGNAAFRREVIYRGPDPAYGSSGIQIVDFDNDQDLDIVYSNGDSLDSLYLKPFHAVHWLENTGQYPFRHHQLTALPGASRALAADIDADGDMDIVAASYLPENLVRESPEGSFDTLILLEQVSGGEFRRHRLEASELGHIAMDVADFDSDGDVDIVVGNHATTGSTDSTWMTVFWNEINQKSRSGHQSAVFDLPIRRYGQPPR